MESHLTSRDRCMEESVAGTLGTGADEVAMLLRGSSGLELQAEDVLISGPYQRHEALAYLIDFMEARGTLHILRFWMEVQHFSQVQVNGTASRIAWNGEKVRSENAGSAGGMRGSNGSDSSMGRNEESATFDIPSYANHSVSDAHQNSYHDVLASESGAARSFTSTPEVPSPRLANNPEMEECALRIFGQYLGLDAPEALQLPVEDPDALRHGVLELMCREDGFTDLDCFRLPQQLAWHLITSRYFDHFRISHHFLQYKSHLVLSDHFYLFDILNSPQTLPYFLEYSEWCGQPYMDALCFLLSCLQFLRHSSPDVTGTPGAQPSSRDQIASDACAIFDKYLSARKCSEILSDKGIPEVIGSVLPVGKNGTAVGAEQICSHFRQALARLYDYFSKVHLASFFRSQSFMRFLVDLEVQQKVALFEAGLYRPNTPIDAQSTSNDRGLREQRSSASRQSSSGKCPSLSYTESRSVSRLESVDEPGTGGRGCRASIAGSSDYGSSLDLSTGTSEAPVRALKKMTLGEVDALGRFVSFAENEPAGIKSNMQFLRRTIRRLKKVEEQRRKDGEASLEAQRIIEDTLQMAQCPSLDSYN